MTVEGIVIAANNIVWGPPLLSLLLGLGVFLTIGLKLAPLREVPSTIVALFDRKRDAGEGDVSPFGALMTSLASTVGTANIAGVAVALTLGGPGAIFWMWVTAIVGMATAYSETVLAIVFREKDHSGQYQGGPMYYIKNGLGRKFLPLAVVFAFFGLIAAFGTGASIQAYSVAEVMLETFEIPPVIIALLLSTCTGLVILGGVKRIATVASFLVPIMAAAYMGCGLFVIAANAEQVPQAFASIFAGAFGYDAALGGASAMLFWFAIQRGVARGFFSNEAGQGSTPMAHAAAKTSDPTQQGMYSVLGVLIDTLLICTVTALVILTSGVQQNECTVIATLIGDGSIADHCRTGAGLTAAAFESELPGIGGYVVTFGLLCFGITTIIGWTVYGERCIVFLFGVKSRPVLRYAWVLVTFSGAAALAIESDSVFQHINLYWLITDLLTGLMAAPNLVALVLLWPVVKRVTQERRKRKASKRSEH